MRDAPVNESFTNTEIAKDHVQNIFDINTPGQPPETRRCGAQFLGDKFFTLARFRCLGQCTIKRRNRLFQQLTMTRSGDDARLDSRKILFGESSQMLNEQINSSAVNS